MSASTARIIGWSTSCLLKHAAMPALCSACASAARIMPADAIAQSSRVSCTISRMVRMPAPFLADAHGIGVAELDLRRGIGAVAELVLQPLEVQAR